MRPGAAPGTGGAYGWGDDNYRQLGDGLPVGYRIADPTPPAGIGTGVTDIAAFGGGTFARKGGAWHVWGYGSNGETCTGAFDTHYTPTTSLIPATAKIAGGGFFELYLDGGAVYGCGDDGVGALGDGGTTNTSTPVAVPGLGSGVVDIAAGDQHGLALLNDASVVSWGYNQGGQLGHGTTARIETPAPVSGLSGVQAVAAGIEHSLALKTDGTVVGWGRNALGEVGDNTTTMRTTPVPVPGLSGVTQIVAANSWSMALKSDGTVWVWGGNFSGQLGDGTTSDSHVPEQVAGLTGITQIAGGNSHAVALSSSGTVYTWGGNGSRELGNSTTADHNYSPAPITGLTATQIVAGRSHTSVLLPDGSVRSWGDNGSGSIGNGPAASDPHPVPGAVVAPGDAHLVAVDGGYSHTLGLTDGGAVLAWGRNTEGQLGTGSPDGSGTPAPVTGLGSGVQQVAASLYNASYALKNDGSVVAWGSNENGELGDGTTTGRSAPGPVTGLGGPVASIAAGAFHGLAAMADGTVRAWGSNVFGNLGDGSTNQATTAVSAAGLSGITGVGASDWSSYAISASGDLYAWGRNESGQLGDGTLVDQHTPELISGIHDVVSVTGGYSFAAALDSHGSVWTWGDNQDGQLGDGTNTDRSVPTPVTLPGNAIAIATGGLFTLALLDDGSVYAWGFNGYGAVGGSDVYADVLTPSKVNGLPPTVFALGAGAYFSLAVAEPPVPYAPTIGAATGGNASASVAFTAPVKDGGSPITGYTASCVSSDGGTAGSAGGSASPITVSGLTNGRTYTCTVSAQNANGSGDASLASTSFVPATVPDAPLSAAASLTGATASVSFATPSSDGGSPITGYAASCVSTGGGSTRTGARAASPISVAALSPGTTYTCSVTASNAVGGGPASGPSNPVSVANLPGAPTAVKAVTGATATAVGPLTVTFTPPASNGGSAITGYRATCTSSNGGATRAVSASASPITVSGTTTGKSYACRVTATNAVGTGAASAASPPVVVGAPAAPTGVTTDTGAAGSLVVSFVAGVNNGAAITSYTATCVSSNTGVTGTNSGAGSPLTVPGLSVGKTYTCTVSATNSRGAGAASTPSSTVIVGAPSAPSNVKAVSGPTTGATGSLTVTFAASANNGAAITSYTATCVSSNGGATSAKSGAGSPLVVAGVTTAKTYTCSVKATNSRGAGPSAAALSVIIVGSPAPPTGVSAVKVAAGQLRVTFTAGANNGAAVSSFTATCVSSNGGATSSKSGVGSPLTVTGLTTGKAYTCTVNATNSRGAGLASAASAAVNA